MEMGIFRKGLSFYEGILNWRIVLVDWINIIVIMVIIFVVIIILMIIFIVIGNIMICYIIYCVRCFYCLLCFFLVNLVINDILVGVFLLLFGVVLIIKKIRDVEKIDCDIIGYL